MKQTLRRVILDIRKNEYLTDALARHGKTNIPTNVILNKMLPGLGATHAELIAERDSIIIEPNVPAIRKKEEKHPHILGIYRGVTVDQIVGYLQKRKHRRKLVSTPEGFAKIQLAMKEAGINMYQDFFMLFDECEKIIQDIDYREAIELPIKDFFRFETRAFVSATPIIPSDPRFAGNGFTELLVRPEYPYKKSLRLITTNNIVLSVTELLKSCRRKVFVFINSIDTIDSIFRNHIDSDKTVTFCSTQGLEKLYDRRNRKAYEEVKETGRVNFLTGRFYSAVDIDLNEKPDIILISDLYGAEQSIIDPRTEAIQIAGRFRNGINSMTHVSSIRPDLECLSQEEAEEWIKGAESIYKELAQRSQKAVNRGERDMLTEATATLSYAQFTDAQGKRNFFKTDNFIEHEKVKSLYRSAELLLSAYRETEHFDISHLDMQYEVNDNDRLTLHRLATTKSRRIFLLNQFEKLQSLRFSQDNKARERYLYCIKHLLTGKDDYLFLECYNQLGATFIKEADFNPAKIKRAVEANSTHYTQVEASVKKMVQKALISGKVYSRADISAILGAIYKKAGKPFNKRVNATEIKKYLKAEEQNTTKERGFRIC